MGWALHTKHMRRIFDGAVVGERDESKAEEEIRGLL
jgi:hypothetical protein